MLRTLLADRFRLKAHHVTEDVQVYALVVDKQGPKLKKSAADTAPSEDSHLRGRLVATQYDLASLIHRLQQEVDRKVVDLTKLTGFYDLKLEWTPNQGSVTTDPSSDPSIFTAVKTQLGLRLESRKKYPVEFLIIDRAEKPEAN